LFRIRSCRAWRRSRRTRKCANGTRRICKSWTRESNLIHRAPHLRITHFQEVVKHRFVWSKWDITHNVNCLAKNKYSLLIVRSVFFIGCSSKTQIRFEACLIKNWSKGIRKKTFRSLVNFLRVSDRQAKQWIKYVSNRICVLLEHPIEKTRRMMSKWWASDI
jgi:hypothetical protein